MYKKISNLLKRKTNQFFIFTILLLFTYLMYIVKNQDISIYPIFLRYIFTILILIYNILIKPFIILREFPYYNSYMNPDWMNFVIIINITYIYIISWILIFISKKLKKNKLIIYGILFFCISIIALANDCKIIGNYTSDSEHNNTTGYYKGICDACYSVIINGSPCDTIYTYKIKNTDISTFSVLEDKNYAKDKNNDYHTTFEIEGCTVSLINFNSITKSQEFEDGIIINN